MNIRSLANCNYQITNRNLFDAIPSYTPTDAELAAPAASIVVADCLYGLTHSARVAMAKATHPERETKAGWLVLAETTEHELA